MTRTSTIATQNTRDIIHMFNRHIIMFVLRIMSQCLEIYVISGIDKEIAINRNYDVIS